MGYKPSYSKWVYNEPPPLNRPLDLFGRVLEWNELSSFATSVAPGIRLGIVSGRRRQGKSFLLRRMARMTSGLYHQAQELERRQALARFAEDVSAALGLPTASLHFDDWDVALRTALGMPREGTSRPSPSAAGPSRILVIDEMPYLLPHSPELPSIIQELIDESRDRADAPSSAIIVCGSALTVMSQLLSGTKPLRGRAGLDLAVRPFGFRDAASYWGVTDPQVAFLVDAVLGGTPGYRPLIDIAPPAKVADVPQWLRRSVLNPAHALFNESDYLLREDPRITDKQVFTSILRAIADGRRTQGEIGAALGRDHNQLRHPLGILVDTGFVLRDEDVLRAKNPLYSIADPMVRFAEVVQNPFRPLLEEGEAERVWALAAPAFSAQVVGPHFERLCRVWASSHAQDRWGATVERLGPAVINDTGARAQHQVDVVALGRGAGPGPAGPRVLAIGEAKASGRPRVVSDVLRLERIRGLLVDRGLDAAGATLVVFGRSGFDREVSAAARDRRDVDLVDLATMYGVDT